MALALAGLLLAAGCSSGTVGMVPDAGAGLAGRYYWGTADGTHFLGVYFADGSHAYSGLPHQGLPTCTGNDTGSGTPQGIGAQGCVAYTYDASSGAVTVGDLHGTYSGNSFTLDGLHLAQLTVPKPGSTLAVTLQSVYASGAGSDFSAGFNSLTLADNGTFTTANGATLGTLNGDVTAIPADQRGTYRITSNGRLELDFASGTNLVRTIGTDIDERSDPKQALRGAMLDSTYYANQATMNN